MGNDLQTFEVKVTWVKYPSETDDRDKRNGGESKLFYILAAEGPMGNIAAKGDMLFRPKIGEHLKLTGEWKEWNGTRQFAFRNCEIVIPVNPRDMLRYACELTKGFGPSLEEAIWKAKGEDWQDLAEGDVKGITPAKLQDFRATIEEIGVREQQSRTIAWLMGHGLTANFAQGAWVTFGKDCISLVEINPYNLTKVPQYGFAAVDNGVRQTFGIEDNDPRRIDAGIMYCIGILTERGNTVVTWYELANECANKLPQISDNVIAVHVADFFKTGALVGFSSTQSISLAQHYRAEKDIYNYVKGE
jgi:exodeoxyribonuclease V alpha subunit